MKYLLIASLLIASLFAEDCDEEYSEFPELTGMWSIRIDEKSDIYGCRVIPVYAFLKETNSIELMDAIDEDSTILEPILDLFKHKDILKLIVENDIIKSVLVDNAVNKQFLTNMNYLFNRELNSALMDKIRKKPNYLQYFVLAAINANTKSQLKSYYNRLRNISGDKINTLLFISVSLGDSYQFDYILDNFFTLKKNLSKNQLTEIAQYPEQLAYFLYPSKDDMKLYGANTQQKQKEFQKLIISIYKDSYDKFISSDANEMALTVVENIYPYIVENRNYNALEKVFNELISRNFIDDIFRYSSDYPCSDEFKKNFSNLFADNNINNVLKFKNTYPKLYEKLLDSKSGDRNIFSLFYIVNVYHIFKREELEVFNNLLHSLGHDMYANTMILKQLDMMDYFKDIIKLDDYKNYVNASDDDTNGMSAQKYKYILITSSESQDSPAVIDYIALNKNDEAKKVLRNLYSRSIGELERHTFTNAEKTMYWVDKADWALTGISICAAPFTGGASLGYIAVKSSGKTVAKKGIKYYAKKLALGSRKFLNKGISLARKGRKSLSSKVGKSKVKAFSKQLDRLDDRFQIFQGAALGGLLYFALPNDLEAKKICEDGQ